MRLSLTVCVLFGLVGVLHSAESGTILGLYDAFGKPTPGAAPGGGYSALIRLGSKTILFDAGGDADRFARNAKALGADLKSVDFAVLSHRHGTHAPGFDHVLRVNPSLKLYIPDDPMLGGGTGLRLPVVPRDIVEALPLEQ